MVCVVLPSKKNIAQLESGGSQTLTAPGFHGGGGGGGMLGDGGGRVGGCLGAGGGGGGCVGGGPVGDGGGGAFKQTQAEWFPDASRAVWHCAGSVCTKKLMRGSYCHSSWWQCRSAASSVRKVLQYHEHGASGSGGGACGSGGGGGEAGLGGSWYEKSPRQRQRRQAMAGSGALRWP